MGKKRSKDLWFSSHEVDAPSIPYGLAMSKIGQFATATLAGPVHTFLIPEATLQSAIWSQSSSISTIQIKWSKKEQEDVLEGGQSRAKMPTLFLNESWFTSHHLFE